jgi:hypothetical protein
MKQFLTYFITLAAITALISCKSSQTTDTQTPAGPVANPNYAGQGGEAKETVSEGVAQITSSGEQDAKNRAVEHALRLAVEKVLGAMIKSETAVENGTLIEDKIFSKSSGYVQKYHLLNYTKSGSAVKAVVKAWVVTGDVKDDAMALGLLQDRVGRPNVLVIVDEPKLDGSGQGNIAKNLVEQKLSDKQFRIVDQATIQRVLLARNMQVSEITGVSTDKLGAVAVDAGAQLFVKGKVDATKQDVSSALPDNWTSVRTTIMLKAVYAADGTQIATASGQSAAAHLSLNTAQNNAISKTTEQIISDFISDILKKWDDMSNNGFEYDITVAGIDFGEAAKIKSDIEKNIEGIKYVNQRGFNNNQAQILVRYTGKAMDLAALILSEGKISVPLKMKSVNSKAIILEKQ